VTHLGFGRGQRDRRAQARQRVSRPTAVSLSGSHSRSAGFVERKSAMYPLFVGGLSRSTARRGIIMTRFAPSVIAALALSLSACTNPYDPVQRGLGGGVLGAASGAAIGAAAGGGPGAALGAAIGGATGIFGGVATTPPPPPGTYFGYPAYGYGYPGYGYPVYRYPAYGYPGYGYPAYPQPSYGYPGYSGSPDYLAPPAYGYNGDARYPDYPSSPSYEYHGDAGNPAYPGSSGYRSSGDLRHPTYPGSPSYEYQAHPPYPPEAGPGAGYPDYGYPGDHASEGWSPGTEYPIAPSG
jgi:hypothetical protein